MTDLGAVAPAAGRGDGDEPHAPAGERGATTPLLLGLVLVLLALGGLSLDLWRAYAQRQEVAALADSAAAAGATRLDEAALRGGTLALDPAAAQAAALAAAAAHPSAGTAAAINASATAAQVEVTVAGRFELTLLRLLGDADGIDFAITAAAGPRRSG